MDGGEEYMLCTTDSHVDIVIYKAFDTGTFDVLRA